MENRYNKDQYQTHAMEVRVRYTGTSKEDRDKDLEKALGAFKKLMTREGILQELKDRQYFRSNTERRRKKQQDAIHRARLAAKKKNTRDSKDFRDYRSGDNVFKPFNKDKKDAPRRDHR